MLRSSFLLFLLACKGAAPPITDEPAEPEACEPLDGPSCDAATHCAPIEGVLVGNPASEALCHDPAAFPTFLGCQPAAKVCPPAEITVQDPTSGDAFLVASGCLPEGFGQLNEATPPCASCATTPTDQCAETEGCKLISGRPILTESAGPLCLPDDAMPVGLACIETTDCDEVITWASATPDGPIHQFPDRCVPPGWVDREPVEACTCAHFTPDRCPADCITLFGRPLQGNSCVPFDESPRSAACSEPVGACGSMASYATDPDSGTYWWFPDSCVPEGWGTTTDDSYPACTP